MQQDKETQFSSPDELKMVPNSSRTKHRKRGYVRRGEILVMSEFDYIIFNIPSLEPISDGITDLFAKRFYNRLVYSRTLTLSEVDWDIPLNEIL